MNFLKKIVKLVLIILATLFAITVIWFIYEMQKVSYEKNYKI